MEDRQPISPPSPYDDPEPCPECGIGDAEYMEHKYGCPSGFPTADAPDAELNAFQNLVWEYEQEVGF